MSSTTGFFGLQKLQSGDPLATNDYAFTNRNIDIIDRLLGKIDAAVFEEDTPLADPTELLQLEVVSTGGLIPAGRTIRYKYTYVDSFGNESAASPEAVASTDAPITRPTQPGLIVATTGGTLLAGNYFYILSAYATVNTNETSGSQAANVNIPTGSTNTITLTLPSLPAGADGFNIFRRGPGEVQFFYLDTVDMDVATPPSTYLDDNSVTVNNSRTPSAVNLTNSTNIVNVTLPGATPSVPEGYTWKLYRTYISGDYNSSLLEWIVTESSGDVVPNTVDSGLVTTIGIPPSISSLTGATSRISTLETGLGAIEVTLGTDPEAGFTNVAAVIAYILSTLAATPGYSQEEIEDFVAAMFVGSAHVNATVTYEDAATPSGRLVIDADNWALIGLEVTNDTNPWAAAHTLVGIGGNPAESQLVIETTATNSEFFAGRGPSCQAYSDMNASRIAGVSSGSTLEAYAASDDFIYSGDVFVRAVSNDGSSSEAFVDISADGPTSTSRIRLQTTDGIDGARVEIRVGEDQTQPALTMRDGENLATPISTDDISFRVLSDGSLVFRSQIDGSLWKLLVSAAGALSTTAYTP